MGPNAAPARAALAVIPVLIMRTTSNSIYKSMPEGSQWMWLDDFVTVSMILCVFTAIHFSIVQYLRLVEKRRASKLVGLTKSKATAQRLVDLAHEQHVPLITLLEMFAPVETELTREQVRLSRLHSHVESEAMEQNITTAEQDRAGADHAADVQPAVDDTPKTSGTSGSQCATMKLRSDAAKDAHVTEADLLFITYASDIFRRFDANGSNKLDPKEFRKALTFFDIYMSEGQVTRSMCRFLRDRGHPTPLDENKASLNFSQFVLLLMQIEQYSLKRDAGLLQVKAYFQSIAPSERCDVVARFGFPVLLFMQFMIFFCLLAVY